MSVPLLNPIARLRPSLALLLFGVACCGLANIEIWGMRQVGIRGVEDRLDPRFMLPTAAAGWIVLRGICLWLGGLAAAGLAALSKGQGQGRLWAASSLLLFVEAALGLTSRQLLGALDGDAAGQARVLHVWLQLELPLHAVAMMAAGAAFVLRAVTGSLTLQLIVGLTTLGGLAALAAPWAGSMPAEIGLFVAATCGAIAAFRSRRG